LGGREVLEEGKEILRELRRILGRKAFGDGNKGELSWRERLEAGKYCKGEFKLSGVAEAVFA